jgi:hypothetical protein
VNTLLPILLLGVAGFAFGGVYALFSQRKPMWITGLVALFGVLSLVAAWLYL